MSETTFQEQYDSLLEEKSAFQQAGMDAKVKEWDHKLECLEIGTKYPKITMKEIADKLGMDGLNHAVAMKNMENEDKFEKYCGSLLSKSRISETQLYTFLDQNDWKWKKDTEITKEIIRLLAPKLSSTHARKQFELMFKIDDIETPKSDAKMAVVKIERIEDYSQNDNPPMEELLKVVTAKVANLFHTLYIAYPMIGRQKDVDPIIFGVLRDPNKSYSELNEWNSELTTEQTDFANLGEMYQVAQWV